MLIDVDGDGAYLPLTDGLLLLRFGFGFSGATLTTSAVGPNCTRCDAAIDHVAISAQLGLAARHRRPDGQLEALTDGLSWSSRWLFGFTGAPLDLRRR